MSTNSFSSWPPLIPMPIHSECEATQVAMATGGPSSLVMDAVPVDHGSVQYQVGYKPDIFEKKEDKDKFACAFCGKILREPMQFRDCGHRFCTPCVKEIEGIIKSNKTLNCRACHEEANEMTKLDPTDMFADKGIKREMSLISTKCPNEMCIWTGHFKDYIAHEEQCKHQPVKCELCNEQVSKNKFDTHKKQECSQRIIKCDHCGTQMPFVQKMTHVKDCLKYPEPCTQCGKRDIPRDMMKKHKSRDCEKRTVSCPVEGCSVTEPQNRFQQHVQKDQPKHLTWLLTRFAEVDEAVSTSMDPNSGAMAGLRLGPGTDLPQAVEVLKAKIEQLEEQLVRHGRGATGGHFDQATGGAEGSAFGVGAAEKLNAMEFKVNSLEPILSVLHGEMNRCIGAIEALEAQLQREVLTNREFRQKIEQYERTISAVSTSVTQREAKMKEMETRLNTVSQNKPDGTLLWKISGFSQVGETMVYLHCHDRCRLAVGGADHPG